MCCGVLRAPSAMQRGASEDGLNIDGSGNLNLVRFCFILKPGLRKILRFNYMNTSRSILAVVVLSSLSGSMLGLAQGPMTTGTVKDVTKKPWTVTVLSDQTRRPIVYSGMEKAVVQFGSGKPATLRDVEVGQYVSVVYDVRGRNLIVNKLVIPDPKPPVPAISLTRSERRALGSKAARDNDITTQPGSKARIDNDITTKPGIKDPGDRDITRTVDR